MPSTDSDFEDFVAQHGPGLLAFAQVIAGNRADGEDLVQASLTSAYVRWSRLTPETRLAYVRRSIANGRTSLWRRQRTAQSLSTRLGGHAAYEQSEEHLVSERLLLVQALRALPRQQRAVLVMRYLLDLPDDEIAATLTVALSSVRSQAHRGLKSLRESLERQGRPGTTTTFTRSALTVPRSERRPL